jgi:hypothetical protein
MFLVLSVSEKKINTNKLYYLLLMGEFIEKINKDTIEQMQMIFIEN